VNGVKRSASEMGSKRRSCLQHGPAFRNDDRLHRDLRETCLMSVQLEKGLKAVGLAIRTGRDPSAYFRGVSRGREMFTLPQQFL